MKTKKQRITRAQKLKQQKDMELPINQFLNAIDKDGNLKYESATLLRKYYIADPDPVLDMIRLANAVVHELRFHKTQAAVYLKEHVSGEPKLKNEHGQPMSLDQCYLKYIAENHACHTTMSKLRQVLAHQLMPMCGSDIFTFEQFDQYVLHIKKIVAELGFELFPIKVDVIQPL